MGRKISQAGVDLIKSFEGCRLTAYKPVPTETYWTIGYGHYGPDVTPGMKITQEQAEQMLVNDLGRYEAPVNNPAYVSFTAQLNQNQFDALVSFCYNCGAGNLKGLCAGRTIDEIPQYLVLYNKAGGNVLAGLVRRRKAEVDLYQKEDEEEMLAELVKQLQTQVQSYEGQVKSLTEQVQELKKQQEAPKWFIDEFGSADLGGLITTPNGSYDFWRNVAITARLLKKNGVIK